MPMALILSSYVAASRVGGGGQQYALAAFGIDPVLVPTVLFGRHPGKGPPGGGAVPDAMFASATEQALADVALEHADAVITGYFASAEQVRTAAAAIDRLQESRGPRTMNGGVLVVVDPIMGDDETGLYVRPEVADAVAEHLVPRADWLTPNRWECERLTGDPIRSPADAAAAGFKLAPVLVTSVPCGPGEIGMVCADWERARLFAHAQLEGVPRGTGDLVTAVFTAGLVAGMEVFEAAERAARSVAEAAQASTEWNAPELPLVALGARVKTPSATVRTEEIA